MANIDVVNNINAENIKFKQKISMVNENNAPLLQVYTPSQSDPLALLQNKNENKIILKFYKNTLENLTFEENQSDIEAGLNSNKDAVLALLNDELEIVNNSAVMMNISSQNNKIDFQIKASSSGKSFDITISPLGLQVIDGNKIYKANIKEFDSLKNTDKRLESNHFVLSTQMFEKIVGNTDSRFAHHTIDKIPSFMWYQYFSTANLQNFKPQPLTSSLQAIKFSTTDNLNVYSVIDGNTIKIFHDGSFRKISRDSIKLFQKQNKHFLIMEYSSKGKNPVSIRIDLPSDEKERNNIIQNWEKTFSVNFKKNKNGKYSYERKDSTSYAEYSFRLPSKRTFNLSNKKEKDSQQVNLIKSQPSKSAEKEKSEKVKKSENSSKSDEQDKQNNNEESVEQDSKNESVEIPEKKKKFDTSFWAETGSILVAAAAIMAAALTGIGAFAIAAIVAMSASAALTVVNGKELVLSKRNIDTRLKNNKYTLFRESDNEYTKSLENFKAAQTQVETWLESDASAADFGKQFIKEYSEYGRQTQEVDYAARFREIKNSQPTESEYEMLTNIYRANTEKSKQEALNAFISSQPADQQERLRAAFSKTSFFDRNHYMDQAQVAEGLDRLKTMQIMNKDNIALEKEKKYFIENTFPNLDNKTKINFLKEFKNESLSQANNSSSQSKIGKMITQYFGDLPTLSQLKKEGKTKNQISSILTKDEVEKDLQTAFQNSDNTDFYVNQFLKKYIGAMHENQVQVISKNLLNNENIAHSEDFIRHCQKLSGTALSVQQKRNNIESIIKNSNPSFVEFLFRYEKNSTRQKQLVEKYGDLFMLNLSRTQNSQMLFDRLTGSMDNGIKDYAIAHLQYESRKIDRTIAKLHENIYQAQNIKNKIETQKNLKESLDQLKTLNLQSNITFEDISNAYYDELIQKSDLIALGRTDKEKTSTKITTQMQKDFIELHKLIRTSGILNNIFAADISKKDDNNIYLSENTEDKYLKKQKSKPELLNTASKKITIIELTDNHIKEALINQYIEMQAQTSTSEDFDEKIVQQYKLRKHLSEKTIDEIETEISQNIDLDKFYKINPALLKFKNYIDKKKDFENKYGKDLYNTLYNYSFKKLLLHPEYSGKSSDNMLNENENAINIINLLPASMKVSLINRIDQRSSADKKISFALALKQELPKLIEETWSSKTTNLLNNLNSPSYIPDYEIAKARRSFNNDLTIYASDLDTQLVKDEIQSLQSIKLSDQESFEKSEIEENDRELLKQHKKLIELEIAFESVVNTAIQNHGHGQDVNYTKAIIEFAQIIQNNAKNLPSKYVSILQNALSGKENDKTINEIVMKLKSISLKNGEKASAQINNIDKKLNIKMKQTWESFVEQINKTIKNCQEKNENDVKKNKAKLKDEKVKQKPNAIRRKLRFFDKRQQKTQIQDQQFLEEDASSQMTDAQINYHEQSSEK